jgi:hypothetical protein
MSNTRHPGWDSEWEAIRATDWDRPGHPRRLVYWVRVVRGADAHGHTERLTVGHLGDGWAWAHRGPDVGSRGVAKVHTMGEIVGTTAAAKRAADRYFAELLREEATA